VVAVDYGLMAQKAAEAHLDRLDICLDQQEEDGDLVDWPESSGPYDGCQVCVVRETLWIAWPIMERSVGKSS
jgi:hypothetical protein